jgi:hypothetical protein
MDNSDEIAVPQPKSSYDVAGLRRPQSVADLGRESTALYHIFGSDMSRNGNLYLVSDEIVMYATPSSVVFQNIVTGAKNYLFPIDEGGVGCVAVHPSRLAMLPSSSIFSYVLIVVFFYVEKCLLLVVRASTPKYIFTLTRRSKYVHHIPFPLFCCWKEIDDQDD